MQKIDTIVNLIGEPVQNVPILGFVANLILAAVMCYVLAYIYISRGQSLSNRRSLAASFMMISLTTMFIISVVKSSLALSLGLVGALSIVRFRTAIKEPEELSYLFLAIAIGLGLGADQTVITIVAFVFIVAMIVARSMTQGQKSGSHIYLQINSDNRAGVTLERMTEIVKKHCSEVDLKRHDESSDHSETIFMADFIDTKNMIECGKRLRSLDKSMEIKMLDSRI